MKLRVLVLLMRLALTIFWAKLPLALQKGSEGPTLFNVHNSYQHLILPYMEPYDIDKKEIRDGRII